MTIDVMAEPTPRGVYRKLIAYGSRVLTDREAFMLQYGDRDAQRTPSSLADRVALMLHDLDNAASVHPSSNASATAPSATTKSTRRWPIPFSSEAALETSSSPTRKRTRDTSTRAKA